MDALSTAIVNAIMMVNDTTGRCSCEGDGDIGDGGGKGKDNNGLSTSIGETLLRGHVCPLALDSSLWYISGCNERRDKIFSLAIHAFWSHFLGEILLDKVEY